MVMPLVSTSEDDNEAEGGLYTTWYMSDAVLAGVEAPEGRPTDTVVAARLPVIWICSTHDVLATPGPPPPASDKDVDSVPVDTINASGPGSVTASRNTAVKLSVEAETEPPAATSDDSTTGVGS